MPAGRRAPRRARPEEAEALHPPDPDAFVLSGSLGEWIFVTDKGAATHILNFRKFEPLVWTRVEGGASSSPR